MSQATFTKRGKHPYFEGKHWRNEMSKITMRILREIASSPKRRKLLFSVVKNFLSLHIHSCLYELLLNKNDDSKYKSLYPELWMFAIKRSYM